MNRFFPSTALLLLIILTGAVSVAQDREAARPPKKMNVLFLISDDLRPELGCYGVPEVKSPNIDRLAARGVLFRRAYCQQAVCSPSRSSVMTGMRPDKTGVLNLTTHFRKALPDVVTLPQLFRNHGYVSRGLGKIYHGSQLDDAPSWSASNAVPRSNPLFFGSDKNRFRISSHFDASRLSWDANCLPLFAWASVPIQEQESETDIPLTKTDRGRPLGISNDPANGGSDGRLADEAIEALRELKENSDPFFLAVGFRKPHLPFVVPKDYWDLYDRSEIPMATNRFLPEGAPDFAMVEKNEMWKYSGVPDTADLPEEFARELKHGYYAAVSYMDAQLGRVLDELDRLELADNTIVILWGDHGWKLGEHNRWCKHSNVEEDTRAPLMISVPGMATAGQQTDAIVEFVDIYPTIAGLAGLTGPEDLQGRSLQPLLEDPRQAWDHVAISQYHRKVDGKKLMGYSMRTDRYRLTRWVALEDRTDVVAVELYDHREDPQENRNIAANPENAETLERLTRQWEETLDSFAEDSPPADSSSRGSRGG